MSLELITQDEFIRKYIPAETKEKKQAFARKKQDCLDMGYTDVFIKPYHNQIFVNERRYQDWVYIITSLLNASLVASWVMWLAMILPLIHVCKKSNDEIKERKMLNDRTKKAR